MLKILSIVGAVAGAAGLSQFPEFSQQYLQRLAGKVDALGLVVVHGVAMIAVTAAIATAVRVCRKRLRWIVVHRWPG